MLERVGWNVVRIRRRDSCDSGHDGNTWREVFGYGATETTHAQDADAITRLGKTRRGGRLFLVRAAIRAADAVDRVQRRKDHQQQDGRELAHLPIMCRRALV